MHTSPTQPGSTRTPTSLVVFIGRFEPLHSAHLAIMKKGLTIGEHLLVIVGSANTPRTPYNPFTAHERITMIRAALNNPPNLSVVALEDSAYNPTQWSQKVVSLANDVAKENHLDPDSITLIGHAKDKSSYYLGLFPQWNSVDVASQGAVSGTDIRRDLFEGSPGATVEEIVASARQAIAQHTAMANIPEAVGNFLQHFIGSPDHINLIKERQFIIKYKQSYQAAPYPPTHVTTDAVVVQSGHVLLVRRKGYPGRGLWALPGGFLEQDERIEDNCLRELMEETKIKVPLPVLRGSIKARECFDEPNRSSRGRTITHAFLIQLPPGPLPKIKKETSETSGAAWIHLSQLDKSIMFEDHHSIIIKMTSAL